jgi:signal transduction histidine kinase
MFVSNVERARTTGDARLVERLVANLVSNAVHHNVARGEVTVTTHDRGGHAVLTVTNTGPTIPPSELSRLFRPFQRGGAERSGGSGSGSDSHGLGLGLSIVDAIAQAHSATITTRAPSTGGLEIEVDFPAPATHT